MRASRAQRVRVSIPVYCTRTNPNAEDTIHAGKKQERERADMCKFWVRTAVCSLLCVEKLCVGRWRSRIPDESAFVYSVRLMRSSKNEGPRCRMTVFLFQMLSVRSEVSVSNVGYRLLRVVFLLYLPRLVEL